MKPDNLAGHIAGQIKQTGQAEVSVSYLWEVVGQPESVTLQLVSMFAKDFGWDVIPADSNNTRLFSFRLAAIRF